MGSLLHAIQNSLVTLPKRGCFISATGSLGRGGQGGPRFRIGMQRLFSASSGTTDACYVRQKSIQKYIKPRACQH